MSEPLSIYIGWDPKEDNAYQVCRASLLKHSSKPLHIRKLERQSLQEAGFYRREWRGEAGQFIDLGDLKPFSTEFSFTRFLVPALNMHQGWSLYCDCDFLFTEDIAKLFDYADDRYAVLCVKHDHDPAEQTKMGGIVQSRYHRKNWSSMVLWNNAHSSNRTLTSYAVSQFAGAWLHAFNWLRDEEIGDLPRWWNWLAGVDEPTGLDLPLGIHFTLGTPDIPGCETAPHAPLWHKALNEIRFQKAA